MVAIAGLAGHQGVAEVVEACVDGLGGGCQAAKGLPSCIEEDVNFLHLAGGFLLLVAIRC